MEASVATGISPAPGSPQEKEELFELNPHVGTNLPLCELPPSPTIQRGNRSSPARRPLRRYPALPQPRQLSAYDPEWEEDADYVERAQQTLREQAATQKLPRPAVLKDILTELTERQAQEQQQAEAEALAAAEAAGPSRELRGASTSVSFEGMADAVRTIINEDIDDARRTRGLTASMAGVQPEPDLARVNAGTGCGLQLDSVWCAPFSPP